MKSRKRALRRHHEGRIKRKITRQYFVYRGMFDNCLWSEPQRLEEYLLWCEANPRYWQGRLLQARTLCSDFCCGNCCRWEGASHGERKRQGT